MAQVKTGTYTGNGVDSTAITAVGFLPDTVIIAPSDGATAGCFRTSSHSGDDTSVFSGSGNITGGIKSLDSDGFTIGTSSTVNTNGTNYYYVAIKKNSDNDFTVGSYTGDGTDNRNITISPSFQPDYIIGKLNNTLGAVWRGGGIQTGDDADKYQSVSGGANLIQAINTDGFQIGTDLNTNGVVSFYLCFKQKTGFLKVGSYSGNGTSQSITGVGFLPDVVIVDNITTDTATTWLKTQNIAGTTSVSIGEANASVNTAITSLDSNGFSVGSAAGANANGDTIGYIAINEGDSTTTTSTSTSSSTTTSTSTSSSTSTSTTNTNTTTSTSSSTSTTTSTSTSSSTSTTSTSTTSTSSSTSTTSTSTTSTSSSTTTSTSTSSSTSTTTTYPYPFSVDNVG